jgi:hypothetical protein
MTAQVQEKIRISDDFVDEIIYLLETSRDYQFAVGDRLIILVGMHDDNRSEVINYLAGQLNISASKLYEYHRVATRWKPEFREQYQALDWTIYRNSDPNDPEDRELLDRCIDEGWNTTTFKEEKYPALKDPMNIIERIKAILTRGRKRFDAKYQERLDKILA